MKVLMSMVSIGMAQIATQHLTSILNIKRIKHLNERIENHDSYFESELKVELPYRKWMRVISITMFVTFIPSILVFSAIPMLQFQLPLTRFLKAQLNNFKIHILKIFTAGPSNRLIVVTTRPS